jgi:hypothetical protein
VFNGFAVLFSQNHSYFARPLNLIDLSAELLGVVGSVRVDFETSTFVKADITVKFLFHDYSGLIGLGAFSVLVCGPLNLYSAHAL